VVVRRAGWADFSHSAEDNFLRGVRHDVGENHRAESCLGEGVEALPEEGAEGLLTQLNFVYAVCVTLSSIPSLSKPGSVTTITFVTFFAQQHRVSDSAEPGCASKIRTCMLEANSPNLEHAPASQRIERVV